MAFATIQKLTTYLMVVPSMLALLLAPSVSMVATSIALAAVGASWFAEPRRYPAHRFARAWLGLTLGFLVYLGVEVTFGGSPVDAGIQFLLLLTVNKLFNRRSLRDYQQAQILSFLMLVAATTVNTGLSYAACFVFYVVAATWALMLLQLRREIEHHFAGNPETSEKASALLKSPRLIDRRYLGLTGALSIGVMLSAVVVFFAFPRIGFGFLSGLRRQGTAMAGFSEHVQLGKHGTIRSNRQVVMRVIFGTTKDPKPPPPLHQLRWRGAVFDHYDGGAWKKSKKLSGKSAPLARKGRLHVLSYTPGVSRKAGVSTLRRLTRQDIYLDPLESTVIFALDRPAAIELPRSKVGQRPFFKPRKGAFGELRAHNRRPTGVRYFAYSKLYQPKPDLLRQAKAIDSPDLKRFLQLPRKLPARVGELARRLTADKTTVYDKVVAVRQYLESSYRYSLDLTAAANEPLDHFLFEARQGHCEYFATALAILLRSVGIHSRHVNGFLGGRWNAYGRYIAVEQGHAHAWTEVLFSNVGWVTFDATPGAGRPSQAQAPGYLDRMREIMDAMRLRWMRYVVEYDLSQQIAGFIAVRRAYRRLTGPGTSHRQLPAGWKIGLAICIAAAAVLVWLAVRRALIGRLGTAKRKRSDSRHHAERAYRQVLKVLARSDIYKTADQTPLELAEAVDGSGHSISTALRRVTQIYYSARFSKAGADAESMSALSEAVDELKNT